MTSERKPTNPNGNCQKCQDRKKHANTSFFVRDFLAKNSTVVPATVFPGLDPCGIFQFTKRRKKNTKRQNFDKIEINTASLEELETIKGMKRDLNL